MSTLFYKQYLTVNTNGPEGSVPAEWRGRTLSALVRYCAILLLCKYRSVMPLQREQQNISEHSDCQDLSDSNSYHSERNQICGAIGITQDPRNDDGVGKDRRNTYQPCAFFCKIVGTQCPDEGCDAAEHHIERCCSAKQVCEETADGNAWYCTRKEIRKHAQCFGNPELDRSECNRCHDHGQCHINGCNGCTLGETAGYRVGVLPLVHHMILL